VDKIIFRIIPEDATRLIELEAGDTHIVAAAPMREMGTYQGDPDYQVVEAPDATIWFVGFNVNAPIVADLGTRKAVGHAIDRDLIQETLYQGMGRATGTYLAGELPADQGVTAPLYDTTEAASLLAEAGWAMGDDGVLVAESVEGVDAGTVFEADYITYNDDEAGRLAEATQNMLAASKPTSCPWINRPTIRPWKPVISRSSFAGIPGTVLISFPGSTTATTCPTPTTLV
jgi:ABC-type transport system substrate-binding protein